MPHYLILSGLYGSQTCRISDSDDGKESLKFTACSHQQQRLLLSGTCVNIQHEFSLKMTRSRRLIGTQPFISARTAALLIRQSILRFKLTSAFIPEYHGLILASIAVKYPGTSQLRFVLHYAVLLHNRLCGSFPPYRYWYLTLYLRLVANTPKFSAS
jgi:hypothetical protein